MTTSIGLNKSTNVRSPQERAAQAARVFFRTQRSRARDGEADVLAHASRLDVPFEGEQLATWSWGEGPAVLLVHGWNGRATQLGRFVPATVESGMRAVAFDHVGHGASSGSSTSIAQMARAITHVAELAGAQKLIAHSLGAASSVLAAHDGLALERAVLVAPPLTPEPWFQGLVRMLALDEATAALTRAAIEAHVGRSIESLHVPTLAAALTQPALIVHDRDDREVPIEAGELLSYAWRGSRLYVTAGLGHNRVLTSPDVIEVVSRFLRS